MQPSTMFDVLQPDEHIEHVRAPRLLDEIWQPVALHVHLNSEPDLFHAFIFAQLNDSIEDSFPILVACEVIVGNEKTMNALREIPADDLLNVRRRTTARFPSLHVDDCAERTLEGAASAGIET